MPAAFLRVIKKGTFFMKLLSTSATKTAALLLSCAAFFLMNLPSGETARLAGLAAMAVALVVVFLLRNKLTFSRSNALMNAAAGLACLAFGLFFYFRWAPRLASLPLAVALHLDHIVFLLIATLALIVLSFYCVACLFQTVDRFFVAKTELAHLSVAEPHLPTKKDKLFLFGIAFAVITIFSTCSFLYPLNYWGDSNVFFTVGKSMLSGVLPYRDLLEHKGPLLYFLHAFAALISYDSFFGMYLIEIAACYAFLFYSYKTLLLFADRFILYLFPIYALVTYSSPNFALGDSAEELCLPLIAYGLYLGLKMLKQGDTLSRKDAILLGLTSGCVFWVKYTMVGFYVGWIVIPVVLCLYKRQFAKLFRMILQIAGGVVLVSIPIVVFFACNGALMDLFEVYFYNNIFQYSDVGASSGGLVSIAVHIMTGFYSACFDNPLLFVLIVAGLYACSKVDAKAAVFCLVTLVTTICFIFFGAISFAYYAFVLNVFSVFSLLFVYACIKKPLAKLTNGGWKTQARRGVVYCTAALLCFSASKHTDFMFYDKSDLPQYQFKEIIDQSETPTLLNFGFLDGGFYTVSGIVPNTKYFFRSNLLLHETQAAQKEYIENAATEFIVSDLPINNVPGIERYTLVATADYGFGSATSYYLYQLTEQVPAA